MLVLVLKHQTFVLVYEKANLYLQLYLQSMPLILTNALFYYENWHALEKAVPCVYLIDLLRETYIMCIGNMKRTILICLHKGQKFKIPGLDNTYRNLALKKVNDCSAQLTGQRNIEISGVKRWTDIPMGYTVSPYTEVEID